MSDIVPIRERGLPRVLVRDARAARLATALLPRLPARAEATVGELGRVTVALVGPAPREPARGESVSFGVGRPTIEGRLSIDAVLARRLVMTALGGASAAATAPIGRLGFAERGLVAGIVARALEALGAPLAIALDAPARDGGLAADALTLALDVTFAGARGWAEVELPARWLAEAVRGPIDSVALRALPVEVRLELGRTFVAAGELAALVSGDAVVFDGHPAPSAIDGEWGVDLVVGDRAVAARLARGGRIEIEGTFGRPRARSAREAEREERDLMIDEAGKTGRDDGGHAPEDARVDATALLAGAPVEIVAEVGRLVLRGEEVIGLGPGVVLTLGQPRAVEVALRVGDEIWAEGELVDVDGALAVRVTRALRPGLTPR